MKAIVYEQYGPPSVLQLRELATPTAKDDEVLIAVCATTVTSGDARMRALNVPRGYGLLSRLALGVTGPRNQILGLELSGVVAAVGKSVTGFEVGTPVFAMSDSFGGCYAEFRAFPAGGAIARKPANVSFEQAAALCFGGTTALDFFRRGKLQKGDRLLVNGASGAVGSAAVQLAKHLGAHVTGVCSGANVELVRSLGVDAVIDYTKEDVARNGATYDLIMDTVGTAPWSRIKGSLTPTGRLLVVLGGLPDVLTSVWVNVTNSRKIVGGVAKARPEDVRLLAELAEAGVYRPVVDRTYPMERIVEAHAYVDAGHKRGNVVIRVAPAVAE
ncbi:MAG: NAD(P)-dependent alcohol dehydrogenase [Gemmatimonadaceae bacterium]|nr:NAD(P)-dependent alcohol dehydrogenase [Gemmatimonadaceae bacterium]